MIFSYKIPNGFGDYLGLLIEAHSREAADRLAEQQIGIAHAPGGKGHRSANPSFDLRDARVSECPGPIIEAFIDSHEVGNIDISED